MTFNITIQKLKIFEQYGVSLGDYEHVKSKHLKILPYSEFMYIERLVQDIKLIKRGLAAPSYEEQVNNRIEESCDDQNTINQLKNLATK